MLDDKVVVPLDDIQVDKRLDYIEKLVMIVERKIKILQQGDTIGKGLVATLERHWVDLGAGGRVAGALPRVIRSSKLQGLSLVQTGENYNIPMLRYFKL